MKYIDVRIFCGFKVKTVVVVVGDEGLECEERIVLGFGHYGEPRNDLEIWNF